MAPAGEFSAASTQSAPLKKFVALIARKHADERIINGWLILTATVGAAIALADGLTRAPNPGLELAPAQPFGYEPYRAAFLFAGIAFPLLFAYAKKARLSLPEGLFLWFVFCTTAYLKDFSYFRLPGTPLFVTDVVLIVLLFSICFLPRQRNARLPLALSIFFVLFMGAGALAAARGFKGNKEPMLVVRDSALIGYALFLVVGHRLIRSWQAICRVAVWFALGTALSVLNGMAWFAVAHGGQRRFVGTGIYVLVSLIGVALVMTNRLIPIHLGWPLVIILSIGLLLANMRSLFIVLATVCLLAMFVPGLPRRRIRSVFLITAAAATILACVFVVRIPHLQAGRDFATLVADNLSSGVLRSNDDPDWQFRLMAWKEAWRRFDQNPLAGEGFGIPFNFGIWDNDPRPHNTFLTVLYKMGLIGFIPFLALLGCFLWLGLQAGYSNSRNGRASFLQIALLAQVSFCIFGCANLLLESPFLASLFWTGIGVGLRIIQKINNERFLPSLVYHLDAAADGAGQSVQRAVV